MTNNLINSIIRHVLIKLQTIDAGETLSKIKDLSVLSFVLGLFGTIISNVTEWYVKDDTFLEYVLGAIIVDLIFGVWKHISKSTFDPFNLIGGLVKKSVIAVSVIYLYGGIDAIITEDNIVKTYFIITLRLGVFMYPTLSALANIYIVSNGSFPPEAIMKKFSDFESSQDVKELIGLNKDNKN